MNVTSLKSRASETVGKVDYFRAFPAKEMHSLKCYEMVNKAV